MFSLEWTPPSPAPPLGVGTEDELLALNGIAAKFPLYVRVDVPVNGGSGFAHVVAEFQLGMYGEEHVTTLLQQYCAAMRDLAMLRKAPGDAWARSSILRPPLSVSKVIGNGNVVEQLREIWDELLPVSATGHSFFERGADSLLVPRLRRLVRDRLSMDLSSRDVYSSTDVVDMASRLRPLASPFPSLPLRDAVPSAAQSRLLLLEQTTPGTYLITLDLFGDAQTDLHRLVWSLRKTVETFPALHTVFPSPLTSKILLPLHGGWTSPAPAVDGDLSASTVVTLADGRSVSLVDVEWRSSAAVLPPSPLDLVQGPLVRLSLWPVDSSGSWAGLLVLPHVAVDGQALPQLLATWNDVYLASDTTCIPLAPRPPDRVPPLDVADIATPSSLRLPLPPHAFPPPAPSAPGRAVRLTRQLHGLNHAFRAMAAEHGATQFVFLLAVLEGVLARGGGGSIASPQGALAAYALDLRREHADAVGMFVETALVRLGGGRETMAETLAKIQDDVATWMDAGAVGLDGWLSKIDKLPSGRLQLIVDCRSVAPFPDAAWGGIKDSGFTPGLCAKFDRFLLVETTDVGITLHLEIDSSIVCETDGASLLDGVAHALSDAVSGHTGNAPVRALSMVDADAQLQLCDFSLPDPECIPSFVDGLLNGECADAVVLVSSGPSSSDGPTPELHFSSTSFLHYVSRVATSLSRLGVRNEAAVTIALPRAWPFLVSFVAVSMAGGMPIYVDPSIPEARAAFIRSDAQSLVHINMAVFGALLCTTPLPCSLPSVHWTSDSAAYAIYTSGTTGRPKGVVATRGGVAAHLRWAGAAFAPPSSGTPALRTALTTSPGFDGGMWDMLLPFGAGGRSSVAAGGCVTLYPGGRADEASPLMRNNYFARLHPTVTMIVPSMLNAILQLAPCPFPSPATILCGGEAVPPTLVRDFLAATRGMAGAELVNVYGPTEATITCTTFRTSKFAGTPSVPIGNAVDHCSCLVLAPGVGDGCLQPDGVLGELHVGGIQLARGYIRRQRLTAERFQPQVEGAPPGTRLYRTGDLVRWIRSDNERVLEFVGRIDGQIKLRGLRIELGEIETALMEVDGVSHAAVSVRGTGQDAYLVAFVATLPDVTLEEHSIRSALRDSLPVYMHPSRIGMLAELPLTDNGKIDRIALGSLDIGARQASTTCCLEHQACDACEGSCNVHDHPVPRNL